MSNGFDASSYVVKANGAGCILTIRSRQNRFWSNGRAIGHCATHRTCNVWNFSEPWGPHGARCQGS